MPFFWLVKLDLDICTDSDLFILRWATLFICMNLKKRLLHTVPWRHTPGWNLFQKTVENFHLCYPGHWGVKLIHSESQHFISELIEIEELQWGLHHQEGKQTISQTRRDQFNVWQPRGLFFLKKNQPTFPSEQQMIQSLALESMTALPSWSLGLYKTALTTLIDFFFLFEEKDTSWFTRNCARCQLSQEIWGFS